LREADFLRQIVGISAGEVLQPPYIGVHEAGFAPPQEAADRMTT
jgi:hypothetical protein